MRPKIRAFKNKTIEVVGTGIGVLWVILMLACALVVPASVVVWCVRMIIGVL